MYLRRRLEHFLADLRDGSLQLSEDAAADTAAELAAIQMDGQGAVILSSCGPRVRALARAHFKLTEAFEQEAPDLGAIEGAAVPSNLAAAQEELFGHFEEVYAAFTGAPPDRFVPPGSSFSEAIRNRGAKMASWSKSEYVRWAEGVNGAVGGLKGFYAGPGKEAFRAAKSLPGQKLVLGGQRFTATSKRAVQQMALYADTLLIPDPVMPWLERDRQEERFRDVLMVKQIHQLFPLRGLSQIDGHPLVVFPSWEKSLEAEDPQTQDNMELAAIRLVEHFVGEQFEDFEELFDYAEKNTKRFLRIVEENRLFVPPGGNGTETLDEGIALWREDAVRRRSDSYLDSISDLGDHQIVLMFIMDRIAPVFHVLENAGEFSASPLFGLPQQWHYFKLWQRANAGRVAAPGADPNTALDTVRALTDERHAWLGAVPLEALVELRERGANIEFRRRLTEVLLELECAHEGNYEAQVARVGRGLQILLREHDAEVRKIERESREKYSRLAIAGGTALAGAFLTSAAQFLPWFPDVGMLGGGAALSAFGLGTKYATDKLSETQQLRRERRTLMGYLATAAMGKQ